MPAAEESLRMRLQLVTTAFWRLAIASGAVTWTEPDQFKGGANR